MSLCYNAPVKVHESLFYGSFAIWAKAGKKNGYFREEIENEKVENLLHPYGHGNGDRDVYGRL